MVNGKHIPRYLKNSRFERIFRKMNLQKNIAIPELLNLCENHGYDNTLLALKEMHFKENHPIIKAVLSEKLAWLEGYISTASGDGSENTWNDLPF